MDSSFTPDSQGILSAALSAIVPYLHQNERDKGHWERLRRIILNDLNTVMSDKLFSGYSPLCILASTKEGRQLLMEDSILPGKITAEGLNAIIAEGQHRGKSALYFLADSDEGRQLLSNNDLLGKITAAGLNAVIAEEQDRGKSALWCLVSCPEGWSLLKDHKILNEKILFEGLVSTFMYKNSDGTVKRHSVLAHVLEDENKHAILFNNPRLMARVTDLVTSCLSSSERRSQVIDDQSVGDYVVKLLLENAPAKFSAILNSQGISSDDFTTYFNAHPDLISAMTESTDGQSIYQTYVMSSGIAQRTDVSISQQSIFDVERYVDQNPSRSNYLK